MRGIDKIRQMPIEEMADIMCDNGCPDDMEIGKTECKMHDISCRECWIKALSEEVDHE